MKSSYLIMSALIGVLLAAGCNDSHVAPSGDSNLIQVEESDDAMNAAMAKAKATFNFFETNWKSMPNDGYNIKFEMTTSDGGEEHIWFNPTRIDGDQITAECSNDPFDIPGLGMGDVRTLSKSSVSDWVIMVGNKCYGGYTIKVLAEQRPDSAPPFEYIDVAD